MWDPFSFAALRAIASTALLKMSLLYAFPLHAEKAFPPPMISARLVSRAGGFTLPNMRWKIFTRFCPPSGAPLLSLPLRSSVPADNRNFPKDQGNNRNAGILWNTFPFLLSVCFSMQGERRTFPPAFLFPPATPFYLRVADREKENISCFPALVIEPYLFTRPSKLIRNQHFRGRFRLFGGGASAASSLRTYLKHI